MAVVDGTTWLFVPGDAPHRFGKAAAAGADAVIIDLEDAVHPDDKEEARAEALRWLNTGGRAWIRINAAGTQWFTGDVEAVVESPGLLGIVVPKAESPSSLSEISGLMPGVPVVPLVETAVGLHRVHDLAAASGVGRLAFGSLDMAADVGAENSHDAMLLARTTIVLASRVAGLPAPIDGVFTDIHDAVAVEESARRARHLGFRGKLCIHPDQLGPVRRGFAYSEREIAWAREVLQAAGTRAGATTGPDGRMIDKPVIDRARAILQR